MCLLTSCVSYSKRFGSSPSFIFFIYIYFLNEYCCLTSTEAVRPIRDGDEWEKGKEE